MGNWVMSEGSERPALIAAAQGAALGVVGLHLGQRFFAQRLVLRRHEALSAAARHDFDGFFRGEIVRRELSHYPPFTRAALVSVSDMDRREGQMASLRLRHAALGAARALDVPADYVQGPGPAPLAKIKNRYRFQLLIKARDINALRRIGAAVLQEAEAMARTHLRVRVDIDPQNLL